MSLAAILDSMLASGCSAEQIAAAVKAVETERERAAAERRAKAAEKKRKQRASAPTVPDCPGDIAGHEGTEGDEKSPPKNVPHTPYKITPPNTSLRSDTSAREIFATEFWPAYPRKTERKAAEAKFVALVRSGVDPAAIVDGARRYAASKPEPKFTKHPTTWLNRGCWEDEQLPRDGPPRSQRSVLARMATGEYWNDPDEQPSQPEFRIAAPEPADQRGSGFAGQIPQRAGVDGGDGPLLDLRPERAR